MEPGSFLLEAANWSTIAACFILKLPQGAALLAARSARGVSLESLVLELGGRCFCSALPGRHAKPGWPGLFPVFLDVQGAGGRRSRQDSPSVLIRFVVMTALNIWVIATILEYRKAKKLD
ncbi:PQ-loop repeat-containing protein 3 isoform X2 [Python bivittatus]|uniref:PQ-loop repeat-containing protein 3 isoform X2 n=1 Tax=Python bivittatus TaxID=176946 RepID=A0A9F5J4Y0_PYTBI|nr:PQ-loop repeat-containing protein 3 isoform X2 [Python bivittatus]